jgi:hypothetical protein
MAAKRKTTFSNSGGGFLEQENRRGELFYPLARWRPRKADAFFSRNEKGLFRNIGGFGGRNRDT